MSSKLSDGSDGESLAGNTSLAPQGTSLTQRIIGLAGEKGSGKDASARFIAGINLVKHGYIEEFHSLANGSIEIAGKPYKDVNSLAPTFVKVYHFADYLKQIVHDLLGVSWDSLEKYKNSSTRYKWSDMPGVVTNEEVFNAVDKFLQKKQELVGPHYTLPITFKKDNFMNAREVLQYVGTDIFRKMNSWCWSNYLMEKIKQDGAKIAIVADARFINELDAIKRVGGVNIKLTKGSGKDSHPSENDFLSYQEWDAIIDNVDCKNIRCLNQLLYEGLVGLGVYSAII